MSIAPKQLSNQRVSALTLNSSGPIAALAVVQLDSTGGIVTGGAGSTQVSVKDIFTSSGASVMDGVNNAINVNVVAGAAAGSTIVTISTGSLRVHQSTAADLNAAVVQGSTVWAVQVSSVAGVVAVSTGPSLARLIDRDQTSNVAAVLNDTPPSTAYGIVVRLPAPLMDSTNNALRVFQAASSAGAGSTEVTARQSTYTDFNTLSRLADRDASTQVAAVLNTTPPSTTYGIVVRLPAPLMDSTNNALRVFQAASSAGAGSTEVTVRQSTYTDFNTLSRLADRDFSTQVANITNTTPASTAYGLVVREAVAQSTTVNVSSVGGAVIVRSSAADFLATVYQSTAAALQMTATQNSTAWVVLSRVTTSSGGGVEGSTTTQSTGSVLGLNVRTVQPSGRQSTSILVRIDSAGGSTTLISSVAGLSHKVYAYAVMSTVTAISSCAFLSSLGTAERWGLILGTQSSGITGANLAIAPPGFLFETGAALPLGFSATSSGLYRVSVSWFTEA